MRRTTLGPISSSQQNSSSSSNNGNALKGSRRVVSQRHSHIPQPRPMRRSSNISSSTTSTSRRSSAFGSRSGVGQDPRPISDKKYIATSVRSLIKFLTERHYDDILSPKMFTRIMKKEFINITMFLIREFDSRWDTPDLKFEEQVSLIFRSLRYPFAISKTALVAVGSPHAWPPLLAALMWMVELLSYDEAVSVNASSSKTELMCEANPKMFFKYLGEAYKSFLSGDDEYYLALENALGDKLRAEHTDIENEISALQDTNESLKAAIAAAKDEKSSLPTLRNKKKDFESDLEKFKALLVQLQVHRKNVLSKTRARERDLEEKNQELGTLNQSIQVLVNRIEAQELSAADVAHMASEHSRLTELVKQNELRKASMQERIWDTERKTGGALDELENALTSYTETATRMKILPKGAKNSLGCNYELEMTENNAVMGVSKDLKGYIRPSLLSLKKNRIARMNVALDEAQELQSTVEILHEQLGMNADEVSEMEMKIKHCEDKIRIERERMENAISLKNHEIEEIELKLSFEHDVSDDVASSLSRVENEVVRVKAAMEEGRIRHKDEVSQMKQTLTQVLIEATDHKDICESELRKAVEITKQME